MERSDKRAGCVDYDAELRLHNETLRRACGIHPRDRVLDIGCGTGQTTRDAGRLAVAGSALGVDVSGRMIERARELTAAAGLHNVTFEQGDAEVHPFPQECFDVVMSRFGTMFFSNAVSAFSNIGRSLRPGGRLVMLVWQSSARNEWSVSIQRSLAGGETAFAVPPGTPDPFSLADRTNVEAILDAAGFAQAKFTDVDEPVYYGENVDAALDWVCGFSFVNHVLQRLETAARERALDRLRTVLAAHANQRGVWFDSRAWIVTARRS